MIGRTYAKNAVVWGFRIFYLLLVNTHIITTGITSFSINPFVMLTAELLIFVEVHLLLMILFSGICLRIFLR